MAGAYFIADKMGWELDVRDKGFALAVFAGCLVSMLGPFLKGSFFLLLPLMLALGLCGTPLILAILLYLLNRSECGAKFPPPQLRGGSHLSGHLLSCGPLSIDSIEHLMMVAADISRQPSQRIFYHIA